MKGVSFCILAGLLSATGWCQSVSWSPSKGSFEKGVQSRLSLVFKDCDPGPQMKIPDVEGLQIGQPNSRRSHMSGFSSLLGGKGKTTTLGFPVLANREGTVTIPAFKIATSQGELEVPMAQYQVVAAQVPSPGTPSRPSSSSGPSLTVEDVAQAEIVLDKQELWAGEVLEARLVFQGMTRFVQDFRGYEWEPQQLTLGPWQSHDEDLRVVDGNEVTVFEFPVNVQAPRIEGDYALDSARVGISIRSSNSSRSAFGIFRNRGQQVTLEAKAPPITVKPLPAAPDEYSGAVGEFKITSQLVPESTTIGEPVTWTIELQGTGNWNDVIRMPSRGVPEGFEVIQPKSNIEMEGDSPFTGKMTEDVVLIPTREGNYTIPGITFVYFDTDAGEYRNLTTPDTYLLVEKAKASALAPGKSTTPEDAELPTPPTRTQITPFDGQPQLARDPLGQSINSYRPMTLPIWAIGLLAPWVGVYIYWCWLAWKQVVLLDVGRSRREARERLLSWNAQKSLDAVTPAQLREWQREVERLWQVTRPVPNASRLNQMVDALEGDGPEWSWLWKGCEDVLFGNQEALPSEWSQRFAAALRTVKIPRVQFTGFLKPQVWLPLVVSLLITGSVWAQEDVADEPVEISASDEGYYQAGEFQRIEAALRLRLEENWRDSGAHHDLALALWQQERWDEAAAHASVAALQSPGHESILWDVRLLIDRAGWDATTTGKFFSSQALIQRMVAWRSVHFWQWLGMGSSLILACIVVWGLTSWYAKSRSGQWVRWVWGLLTFAVFVISLVCVEGWGILRHPDTVIVVQEVNGRSIPSEVDQQTRPLPVGTVGFFKKEFLGWRQVMLPNREEVWVRENEVLPVYRR